MLENISFEAIEAMLNTLPIEITLVDHEDVVRYFNKDGELAVTYEAGRDLNAEF